jgi:hypothetical protein
MNAHKIVVPEIAPPSSSRKHRRLVIDPAPMNDSLIALKNLNPPEPSLPYNDFLPGKLDKENKEIPTVSPRKLLRNISNSNIKDVRQISARKD